MSILIENIYYIQNRSTKHQLQIRKFQRYLLFLIHCVLHEFFFQLTNWNKLWKKIKCWFYSFWMLWMYCRLIRKKVVYFSLYLPLTKKSIFSLNALIDSSNEKSAFPKTRCHIPVKYRTNRCKLVHIALNPIHIYNPIHTLLSFYHST